MEVIDLAKSNKKLYAPKDGFAVVEVPPFSYLTIAGTGDPNSEPFSLRVQALYSTAYTLKFAQKKQGRDFKVMPLEGFWSVKAGTTLEQHNRDNWQYTLGIVMPDFVDDVMIAQAVKDAGKKKPALAGVMPALRLEKRHEGRAVQVLYRGAYADEWPTIEALHRFAVENGLQLRDDHHEIYLNDPQRTAPEKCKTILRHPVEPAVR